MLVLKIYTLVLRFVLWFILFPFSLILKKYSLRIRNGYYDYFGTLTPELKSFTSIDGPLCWIHGVSVGEITASKPLIKELSKRGFKKFYITSTCPEGINNAKSIKCDGEIMIAYFPVDLPEHYERLFSYLKPEAVFVMEVDLWPNFVKIIKKFNIPLYIINGRFSYKTEKFYSIFKSLSHFCLSNVDLVFTQGEKDRNTLIKMGYDRKKIINSGNIKFDINVLNEEKRVLINKRLEFEKGDNDPFIAVCGSTHDGEEELMMEALNNSFHDKNFILIIAPRNLKRKNHIEETGRKYGLNTSYWSEKKEIEFPKLIIINEFGLLSDLYYFSDLNFVGGTTKNIGGHSIIEPQFSGKPLIYGPDVRNFKNISDMFVENHCGRVINDSKDVSRFIKEIEDEEIKIRISENSKKIIIENSGVTDRIIQKLKEELKFLR